MTEKRTYKRYPKEFKEEAVGLVREQGYTVTEAAEAVGVSAAFFKIVVTSCLLIKQPLFLDLDERHQLVRSF